MSKTFNFRKALNLFEILNISKDDSRFKQWLECFELMFQTPSRIIADDYDALRGGPILEWQIYQIIFGDFLIFSI